MPVKQELKTKDTQSKIEDQVHPVQEHKVQEHKVQEHKVQEHKVQEQVQVQVQAVRVKEIDTYHSIKWLTGC